MTGSLYGLRNVYKPFAVDDQWFKLNVTVRGKNILIRLNGTLLVDYRAHPACNTRRHGTGALP
ncbi:MAG: hypothetical protein H7Y20_01300 [Bryobacteraceae bacterium]|nr:hypothetical protein [Bryobacteraceae bacterium]